MVLSVLFVHWPIRGLGLAAVLFLAFFLMNRGGDQPSKRGYLIARWFVAGYGLFSALLAVSDLIFPPLT
jgi:hypothetical protein